MATAESSVPVNGSYAPQAYDATAPSYAPQAAQSQASNNSSASEIPKDEVGWYFVEQYYTTLSKSPERLYVSPPMRRPAYEPVAC